MYPVLILLTGLTVPLFLFLCKKGRRRGDGYDDYYDDPHYDQHGHQGYNGAGGGGGRASMYQQEDPGFQNIGLMTDRQNTRMQTGRGGGNTTMSPGTCKGDLTTVMPQSLALGTGTGIQQRMPEPSRRPDPHARGQPDPHGGGGGGGRPDPYGGGGGQRGGGYPNQSRYQPKRVVDPRQVRGPKASTKAGAHDPNYDTLVEAGQIPEQY